MGSETRRTKPTQLPTVRCLYKCNVLTEMMQQQQQVEIFSGSKSVKGVRWRPELAAAAVCTYCGVYGGCYTKVDTSQPGFPSPDPCCCCRSSVAGLGGWAACPHETVCDFVWIWPHV